MHSGLVVSMFTCGAFFGAGFAGPAGDYLGRRKTISLGCLLFCLGGGLQTGARTLDYLYSGRFFAGFGYVLYETAQNAKATTYHDTIESASSS